MGEVDRPQIQVRPAYESWLENPVAIIIIEYVGNRSANFIETKSLAFLKLKILLQECVLGLEEKF